MIDQTKLPNKLVFVEFTDYNEVANAIRTLVVRGAPAIGVSGAFGLALAVLQSKATTKEELKINMAMGKHGSELFNDNDTIMTHCNAGALATVAYGTALGVIRTTKESGKKIKV